MLRSKNGEDEDRDVHLKCGFKDTGDPKNTEVQSVYPDDLYVLALTHHITMELNGI